MIARADAHGSARLITLVVIICAVTLPASILEAGWAPRPAALMFVCLLGLACGAWIGPVRLTRWARWPIIMAGGLALAMSSAGLFNVGLETARARMMTWGADLMAGRVIEDPALVTFGAALLMWWAGYSATHGITSGGRALEALLPSALPLTLNSVYARPSPIYILVMVFGLVILMTWTAQGKRQAGWIARQVDYPDLMVEWMGSGFLLACAACVLALVFPHLTSRTTVEWMSNAFHQPVSQVRQTASRMLGGANPIDRDGMDSVAILPTNRLIGNPPQLSDQVVMWVWTDEPPPLPDKAPSRPVPANKPGWRGLTYAMYTGRGWSNPTLTSRPLSSTLTGNLVQRFEIVTTHGDTVFAANQPVSGTADLVALYRPGADADVVGLRGASSLYMVTSQVMLADEETLRQTPVTYATEITPYLQLPAGLPQRVRDLAVQVTAGVATPYDKAIKTEAFLRTYSYTLDLPPLPEGRDLVDYFLFDAPGGYCDYYASAMVVMLRTVGVPARLASGYARGAYVFSRGAYRVLDADSHSWPEVYFAGIGWVEFEPTASRPMLTRESLPENQGAPVGVSAGQVRAEQIQRQRLTILLSSALVVTLAIVAAAVYLVRRERQVAALPADELIPLLYDRLRKRGAWLGVSVRSSDTPDEFVAAFNRAIERRAARQARAQNAQQAAARIGELYRQASYSPRQPDKQEARQAWDAWRAIRLWTWLLKFQTSDKWARQGKNRTLRTQSSSIF